MKKLTALLLTILISSCATVGPTGTYVAPLSEYDGVYDYDVTDNFDNTWRALIDFSSAAFFNIETYEKDSGLLTLNFGVENPNDYIDCGTITIMNQGKVIFDGTYVNYAMINLNPKFTGQMNISIRDNNGTTNLRVNTRYIFQTAQSFYDVNLGIMRETAPVFYTFDSGGSSTQAIFNAVDGTIPFRTCKPTYLAEKAIIGFIAGLN